ncbi:MAG: 23S rRNA (guanosine(2251)-2'-O)-methyltransferase RlmB [Muribaculaceae bacterium]|nr:23S rRNA (guanosine(2251)-2'-O)-methyltransferase RlmB [Muribaculaceae bacterium]
MEDKNLHIFGIRAVIEAIQAGKEIDKVLIKKDLSGDLANELFALLRDSKIPVQRVPIEKLNRITQKNHQGVVAMVAAVTYEKLSNILPTLFEEGRNPFFVVLDGITDVRNFGAIARTCECAGVDAIVIPERGSVSVNADAVKTSAGALHCLPVCRERSIVSALRFMKACGVKVVGASEKSNLNYTHSHLSDPVAIVLGAEDVGLSPEVLKMCDETLAIPQFGQINSLNVSVAGAIMIYEVVRQRINDNQVIE